jgi:hypothetical protein
MVIISSLGKCLESLQFLTLKEEELCLNFLMKK